MPALPQASQSESQTLQAILSELRSIHNDVRLTAISQILLTELQTQQTVVNAATDRVSRARLELSSLQADEKRTSADLASSQDALTEEADSATKRKHSEEVDRLKGSLAFLKAKEEGLKIVASIAIVRGCGSVLTHPSSSRRVEPILPS